MYYNLLGYHIIIYVYILYLYKFVPCTFIDVYVFDIEWMTFYTKHYYYLLSSLKICYT